jgi:plastocyanin
MDRPQTARTWGPRVIRIGGLLLGGALIGGCAAPAPSGPVATDQIDLPRSYRFDPAAVVVPVGAAVTWTNRDQFTHSVRLPDRTHLILRPGESATSTFSRPGEYPYYCSFHARDMRGTVIVEARG